MKENLMNRITKASTKAKTTHFYPKDEGVCDFYLYLAFKTKKEYYFWLYHKTKDICIKELKELFSDFPIEDFDKFSIIHFYNVLEDYSEEDDDHSFAYYQTFILPFVDLEKEMNNYD